MVASVLRSTTPKGAEARPAQPPATTRELLRPAVTLYKSTQPSRSESNRRSAVVAQGDRRLRATLLPELPSIVSVREGSRWACLTAGLQVSDTIRQVEGRDLHVKIANAAQGVQEHPGSDIDSLDTPSVVIDMTRMDRNIVQMKAISEQRAVSLRPHAKTHKSARLVQRQLKAGAVGITVAKLDEAKVLSELAPCSDIFLAYPIVSEQKARRAVEMTKSVDMTLTLDTRHVARKH